jgi:hypothetical protein
VRQSDILKLKHEECEAYELDRGVDHLMYILFEHGYQYYSVRCQNFTYFSRVLAKQKHKINNCYSRLLKEMIIIPRYVLLLSIITCFS